MSKVYLLTEEHKRINNTTSFVFVGIVTDKEVANRFVRLRYYNNWRALELDDPELLNRIAKESGKN